MSTETELKSCPFCGGEASLIPHLHCTNDECVAHRTAQYWTDAEAIAAWNRRPPPSTAGWLEGWKAAREASARVVAARGDFDTDWGSYRIAMQQAAEAVRNMPIPEAPVPSTAGWLPISTAPKDGTNVLGCVAGVDRSAGEMFWWEGGWRTWDGENHTRTIMYPDRWQPLPPAPSQEGAGQAGDRESDLAEAERHLKAFVEDNWSPGRWEAARSFLLKMEVKRQQVGR